MHALVGEVVARDARVLGRDADARALLRGGRVVEIERRGDAHPAARDAEVERPVQALAAVLEQGVEAGDAEVGAAVLHVGRNVAGAHEDDAQLRVDGREDQAAGSSPGPRRASIPACASSGSVSSRIRPFDRASVIIDDHPLDVGAERAQLRFHPVVAAVEVVDAVDHGLAVGDERRR